MAWLTTTEVVAHLETDIASANLQQLINDAEEAIISAYGEEGSQTDTIDGLGRFLFLSRPAVAITNVTETIGITDTDLSSNDYRIRGGGWRLERLSTGTNPQDLWGDEIVVSYQPTDDTSRRKRVGIDLVRLALQHSGLGSVRDGDHSETAKDYERERQRILSTLRTRQRGWA